MQQQLAQADQLGEGPSSYHDYGLRSHNTGSGVDAERMNSSEFSNNSQFQNAMNARIVENM